MSADAQSYAPTLLPRQEWLARTVEPILEPELRIVDPHHHFWDRPGNRYRLDELASDLESGHNIVATVFVECGTGYRQDGPEAMRSVGETELIAACGEAGDARGLNARLHLGIVGHADLTLGTAVHPVLEAHLEAGRGRMRGIRDRVVSDPDHGLTQPTYRRPAGMMADRGFREGVAALAPFDLSFETWLLHPQIDEFADLVAACPDTRFVLDHCGTPIGKGAYAGRRPEVFADWAAAVRRLAERPNVAVKLGGLGMWICGFDYHERAEPPSSDTLAADWRPWFETCIEAFGSGRCMFESNFPVDKAAYSYPVYWNACKRIAAGASADEKHDLFGRTAASVYRLDLAR